LTQLYQGSVNRRYRCEIKLQVPLSKDKGTTNPRTCPPGKTGSKRRRRRRKIKIKKRIDLQVTILQHQASLNIEQPTSRRAHGSTA
jgi:hypothetical protein